MEEKTQKKRIGLTCLVILISLSIVLSAVSLRCNLRGKLSLEDFEFENRINPNTAAQASLTRLPGIGPVKAKQIIDYRENFLKDGGEVPAFETVSDLDKVSGIGPGTINNIYTLLKFD